MQFKLTTLRIAQHAKPFQHIYQSTLAYLGVFGVNSVGLLVDKSLSVVVSAISFNTKDSCK